MSKIICYSLDFQNKVKEFNTLDELLKDVVGVKEQAEKALNNPDLSYRGFRLISEEKLPDLFAKIVSIRSEKIKKDYVDNLTELETKIKRLEKADRKANVKLEVTIEDYEEKISELKKKEESEKEELLNKQKEETEKINKEHEENISKINASFENKKSDILKQHTNEISKLTNSFEKYKEKLHQEVTRYNGELSILKDKHNKELEEKHKVTTTYLENQLENKNRLVKKIQYKLDTITKSTINLQNILNKIIEGENKTLGLQSALYSKDILRKEQNIQEYKEPYLKIDVDTTRELPNKISIEPLVMTLVLDNEELKTEQPNIKPEPRVVENVQPTPTPKVEPKLPIFDTKDTIVVEKKKEVVINGNKIISLDDYNKLSKTDKAHYLYELNKKNIKMEELAQYYPTVFEDLSTNSIISQILLETKNDKLKFSDLKGLVDEAKSKELYEIISSTKKEHNEFFGVIPDDLNLKPSKRAETIITNEKPVTNNKSKTEFDWVKFKARYTEQEHTRMVFSKDAIDIKEASILTEIPSNQLRNMIHVLKSLGYTKKISNDAFLTPDEIMLLLVSDGWLKTSKNVKNKSNESLSYYIKLMYPSWLEYINNKK